MTKLFDLLPGWLWALALLSALTWGWWQYDDKRGLQVTLARVDTQLAEQKIEAGNKLLEETTRANNAERQLQTARADREILDGKNRETSRAYSLALDDLARRDAGRLRDPAAAECRIGSNKPKGATAPTAVDSGGNTAATGGLLSESLSRLLRSEAEINDKINDAYIACRADTLTIRETIDRYNQEKD